MNGLKRSALLWALGIGLGGQIGTSQAVQCENNIPPSNPNAIYEEHGDGTVTDTRTGLMWKQCSEGQTWGAGTCTGAASRFNWSQALAHAETATFAGYSDWRLPNIKELRSLVEECRFYPAINVAMFPNTPSSSFWSASPTASHTPDAWTVNFPRGFATSSGIHLFHNSDFETYVRLVRDAQ